MTHRNGSPWRSVQDVENLKALLVTVQDRLICIRTHALAQSGNYQRIFQEAELSRRDLRLLSDALTECWDRLYHLATYNGLPREEAPCDD